MLKLSDVNIRKFKLSEQFINPYKEAEVPWGPVGYVTFKRTYARRLSEFEDGAVGTEEWWQTCRRVIEGIFDIQKRHAFMIGVSCFIHKNMVNKACTWQISSGKMLQNIYRKV